MAKITLGGEDYIIPELNFMALERAWPFIETAMVSSNHDPMTGPNAALRIIASGIVEDENFQPQRYGVTALPDNPDEIYEQVVFFFRRKLKAREIEKLKDCVDQIIQEAGLMSAETDDTVGNVDTPSLLTETALAS